MELSKEIKNTSALGQRGENIALAYLKAKNFNIIEKNYRSKKGEIDIICQKNDTLIFTEVKTDFSGHADHPSYWVNKKKQKQIYNIAKEYLYVKNIPDVKCRFDVVTIRISSNQSPEISLYENAFMIT